MYSIAYHVTHRFVVIATEHTEDAEMIKGNVPPVRQLRPFRLIAGLPANWCNTVKRVETYTADEKNCITVQKVPIFATICKERCRWRRDVVQLELRRVCGSYAYLYPWPVYV
jgi:hypothetical protein